MAELTADLFVSLDGFAAGVDTGPYYGYAGPELEAWIDDVTGRDQLLLMGRRTWELMAAMSAGSADANSVRMTETPKAVVSTTLREPLSWANTRVLTGDLDEVMTRLKGESTVPIRTIGSIQLVTSLMQRGLVDRLRLMIFPLLLAGAGREPVYPGLPRTGLELVGTTVLDDRIVLLEYHPSGAPSPG